MTKAQIEAVQRAVTAAFSTLSDAQLRELVMEPYRSMRASR